jgi:hypothetical protein
MYLSTPALRRNREAADKATEQEKRTSRTAAKQADKQDS